MRIEFGHGFGLVRHPEVVGIFQTALASEPRLAESLEGMETHSFLVQPHLFKSESEPAGFQVAVKMRCLVLREQEKCGLR